MPEYDLAFAAFGNDPRAMALHDQLLLWLLRQHFAVEVPDFATDLPPDADLSPYAGTYRSNQLRVDVCMVDGELEETMTYEPLDDVQERIFTRFAGARKRQCRKRTRLRRTGDLQTDDSGRPR